MTLLVAMLLLSCGNLLAESEKSPTPQAAPNVKYKSGKDVNFEELLIQGQLKRPEISVVTGDSALGTDGLLKLRENFLDRIASDIGEENPQ